MSARRLTSVQFAEEFKAKMKEHEEKVKAKAEAKFLKRFPKAFDHSAAVTKEPKEKLDVKG